MGAVGGLAGEWGDSGGEASSPRVGTCMASLPALASVSTWLAEGREDDMLVDWFKLIPRSTPAGSAGV